jgi:excisionase family DNA binding protein
MTARLAQKTYTVRDVADILGYSTNSIYTFLQQKRIKSVRVGRGRFRIPQSEVDRLLLAGKRSADLPQTEPAPDAGAEPSVRIAAHDLTDSDVAPRLAWGSAVRETLDNVPNVFVWFLAMASVCLGTAMFLFSQTLEEFSVVAASGLLPVIRALFLCGGLALTVSEINQRKWDGLRMMSLATLAGCYLLFAWVHVVLGDVDGAALFGLLSVGVIGTIAWNLPGTRVLAAYVIAIAVAVPVILVTAPADTGIRELLTAISPVTALGFTGMWAAGLVFFGWLAVWGRAHSRMTLGVAAGAATVGLVALAYGYAVHLAWGRAFFALTLGFMVLFAVVWDPERIIRRIDRALIVVSLLVVMLLFAGALGVLRVVQTNMLTVASDQLSDKVTYARIAVTSNLGMTRTALEGLAGSAAFTAAITKPAPEILLTHIRGVFEGNRLLSDIGVFGRDGHRIVLYPADAQSAVTDAALDGMLTRAKDTGKTVVEQAPDRTRILIAVPAYGAKNEYVGAVVGAINVQVLGDKLAEIARTARGEYVEVIDRTGAIVVHPGTVKTDGTDAHQLATRKGATGERGTTIAYDERGELTLQAYDGVPELGWGIAVVSPIVSIMRLTSVISVAVFTVLVFAAIVVGMFYLVRTVKRKVSVSDGP